MRLPRRRFLKLTAGAALLPALSHRALAQDYPTRPVRIVLGLAPGGSVDIVTRLIGQWLSARLGQEFVVQNRPGAGTNVATEAVVRAPADGYTLLVVLAANAINATLYKNLNFNFMRDITLVAGMVRVAKCHGDQCCGSCQHGSGVHRLCQSQSGEAEFRVGRQWQFA